MEILVTRYLPEKAEFRLIRELVNPDTGASILNMFVFPEDTMEWRAAEYQIEPTETDLLMDIVLYEPFIPMGDEPLPLLMTAPTIKDARLQHIDRVMKAKDELRPQGPNKWKTGVQRLDRLAAAHPQMKIDWAPDVTPDALQSLRDNHVMEPEVLQEKALNIEFHRERAKGRMAQFARRRSQTATTEQRVAKLRSMRELRVKEPNQ